MPNLLKIIHRYHYDAVLFAGCLAASTFWLLWFRVFEVTVPISLSIGIAVAGLTSGGIRRWPAVSMGIFCAFLLLNSFHVGVEPVATTAALTIGGICTAWVIGRTSVESSDLLEPQALLRVLGAVAIGSLVAAAISGVGIALMRPVELPTEIVGRWIRFGLGMMIATPLVLVWAATPMQRWHIADWLGLASLLAITTAVASWTFLRNDTDPIAWLVYPPLICVALVYHLRGAVTATAIVTLIVLCGTSLGLGPFALAPPHSRTLLAQGFVAVVSASTLLLAAFADKRRLDAHRKIAEQRYRAVFDQHGVGVALLSLDGTYLEMNARGLEICGYAREEIVGADYRLLEPNAPPYGTNLPSAGALGGNCDVSEERAILTRQGNCRILDVATNIVRRPDGTPDHLIAVSNDITERVEARNALAESERRLRLALEASGTGVWEIDLPQMRLHHSAESACLFGQEPREDALPFESLKEIIAEDQFELLTTAVSKAAIAGGVIDCTISVLPANERKRWLRMYGSCDLQPDKPRLLGLVMDVTRDFEAAARLREANERLLGVARLSAMGAVASTLAHELNQPLAALTNYIATCKYIAKARTDTDPAELDALDQANVQAQRAGGIIRRIRAFAQTGEIETQLISFSAIIESARASIQHFNLFKGATLDCDFDTQPATILGDPLQLEQVVTNLARNALEATQHRSEPWLRMVTRVSEEEVLVEIADNGEGLDEAMLSNLFEPFRTTKTTGTGLGLPICRTIVEAHGGRLWAENRVEGGAVFCFALPRAHPLREVVA
ncbi:ATP-binding protein [Sphingomonas sp. HT-1]|uniref:ATP-binding protein n=1 Tax=unclassified Sphingomonas TaxID=196159 RepID=UPI0002EC66DB|nr:MULTISPECIES: ATP-binding protein [unclassified Sphingomonas]